MAVARPPYFSGLAEAAHTTTPNPKKTPDSTNRTPGSFTSYPKILPTRFGDRVTSPKRSRYMALAIKGVLSFSTPDHLLGNHPACSGQQRPSPPSTVRPGTERVRSTEH